MHGNKSLVIPIDYDTGKLIYPFGDLHPKNYGVDNKGNFEVDVSGKLKFDFEKGQLVIFVWENMS